MENFVKIAEIVTGFAAFIALFLTFFQFRKTDKSSKGKFLLDLRELFSNDRRYQIHLKLRNGERVNNWSDIDDYMGLFEICEIMIKNGTISFEEFDCLYRYRIINIVNNKTIVFFKLDLESKSWKNFYCLLSRLFPEAKLEIANLKNHSVNINNLHWVTYRRQFYQLWHQFINII
ncbi:MAG: hypothetical protein WCH34_08785 [Bacteroidota bacterium]